jgi:DNA processing protein
VNEESAYWIAFSVFPGIGPVRFRLLCEYFGSACNAWHADSAALRRINLPASLISSFVQFRDTWNPHKYLDHLRELHVSALPSFDPKYPTRLKEVSDAPFVLYVKGKKTDPPMNLNKTIAVVGTRHITPYGKEVTQRLVGDLVANGFTIVSGLAYGVDTVAHQTTLDNGGKTIAVLGCGIDIIAPASNARLYADIAQGGGAIVSEMPLGLRPGKGLFPARNRIISGLSLGTIVTEGADDSGALITARNAAEQGREVFAVPGPITSRYSKGPAKLLKNGAKLVESVEDILDELGMSRSTKQSVSKTAQGQTKEEQKVIEILARGQMHIDALLKVSGLTMQELGATITILEMRGIVRDIGEKTYTL